MITSEQVRAARALLRWEQSDLATASKVSLPAIKRLEAVPGPLAGQERTADGLQSALEAAGIEFSEGGVTLLGRGWIRVIIRKGEFANSAARALMSPLIEAYQSGGRPSNVEVWSKVTGYGDHLYFFSPEAAALIPNEIKDAGGVAASIPNLKIGFKPVEF